MDTNGLAPQPPQWALAEQILKPPGPRQTLRSYWRQVFTDDEISHALHGLAYPDMANLRLGHELRLRHPEAFDTYASALLLAARGRRHDPLTWM